MKTNRAAQFTIEAACYMKNRLDQARNFVSILLNEETGKIKVKRGNR